MAFTAEMYCLTALEARVRNQNISRAVLHLRSQVTPPSLFWLLVAAFLGVRPAAASLQLPCAVMAFSLYVTVLT